MEPLWPSVLSITELAFVADLPITQARAWARAGIVRAVEHDGTRALYHRDEAVLAVAVRRLQEIVGEKSRLPFTVAAELRPKLAGLLRWNETPHVDAPVALQVSVDGLTVEVKLGADELEPVCRRLDELAEQEMETKSYLAEIRKERD